MEDADTNTGAGSSLPGHHPPAAGHSPGWPALKLWHSGSACVSIAAFIFSILSVLVKLSSATIPVLQLVCVPSLCSAAVLGAWLSIPAFSGRPRNPTAFESRTTALLLLRGLLGAAVVTSYFGALELLPLEDAVTLFFVNPIFVVVLSSIVNKSPAGLGGVLGCLLTITGVVLICHPPLLFGGAPPAADPSQRLGLILGLAAAFFNACAFVTLQVIGTSASAPQVTFCYHAVVSAATGVPLMLGLPAAAVWLTRVQAAYLAGICATTFLGQLLLNRGMQLDSATRGSAINVTQVLYSHVWSLLLFKAPFSLLGLLGSLSIVMGVITIGSQDCGQWVKSGAGVGAGGGGGGLGKRHSSEGELAAEQRAPLLAGARVSMESALSSELVVLRGSRGNTSEGGEWEQGDFFGVEVAAEIRA